MNYLEKKKLIDLRKYNLNALKLKENNIFNFIDIMESFNDFIIQYDKGIDMYDNGLVINAGYLNIDELRYLEDFNKLLKESANFMKVNKNKIINTDCNKNKLSLFKGYLLNNPFEAFDENFDLFDKYDNEYDLFEYYLSKIQIIISNYDYLVKYHIGYIQQNINIIDLIANLKDSIKKFSLIKKDLILNILKKNNTLDIYSIDGKDIILVQNKIEVAAYYDCEKIGRINFKGSGFTLNMPPLAVSINNEYQSKGLGTKLFELLISNKDLKDKCLSLRVSNDNIRALKLYEKFNFKNLNNNEDILTKFKIEKELINPSGMSDMYLQL